MIHLMYVSVASLIEDLETVRLDPLVVLSRFEKMGLSQLNAVCSQKKWMLKSILVLTRYGPGIADRGCLISVVRLHFLGKTGG